MREPKRRVTTLWGAGEDERRRRLGAGSPLEAPGAGALCDAHLVLELCLLVDEVLLGAPVVLVVLVILVVCACERGLARVGEGGEGLGRGRGGVAGGEVVRVVDGGLGGRGAWGGGEGGGHGAGGVEDDGGLFGDGAGDVVVVVVVGGVHEVDAGAVGRGLVEGELGGACDGLVGGRGKRGCEVVCVEEVRVCEAEGSGDQPRTVALIVARHIERAPS